MNNQIEVRALTLSLLLPKIQSIRVGNRRACSFVLTSYSMLSKVWSIMVPDWRDSMTRNMSHSIGLDQPPMNNYFPELAPFYSVMVAGKPIIADCDLEEAEGDVLAFFTRPLADWLEVQDLLPDARQKGLQRLLNDAVDVWRGFDPML